MEKRFRFLEDLATADVAFEAFGKTPGELFENAAWALESVVVDVAGVVGVEKRKLGMKAANLENLLFDFLSELVYLQSAEGLIFADFDIRIEKNGDFFLEAIVFGEGLDSERHKLGTEVKGVTLHEFKVEKKGKGWRAQVVLDV